MKTIVRVTVALKLDKRPAYLVVQAKAIVAAMTGNPYLPTPNPPLATVTAHVEAIELAQVAVKNRVQGAVPDRDNKVLVVVTDLQALGAYVQQVCDAHPADAAKIIESAGLSTSQRSSHTKSDMLVEQGKDAGKVDITVKAAARRAAYEWRYGTDGKTFPEYTITLAAEVSFEGLTPGQTYYYRYRAITKNGPQPWSQIVAFLCK